MRRGVVASIAMVLTLTAIAWKKDSDNVYHTGDHRFEGGGTTKFEEGTTLDVQGTYKLNSITNLGANISASASASGTTNTVTLQAQYPGGDSIIGRLAFRAWLAQTAYAAPSSNGITSVSVTTGVQVQSVSSNADFVVMTATNGQAVLRVVAGGTGQTNQLHVLSPRGTVSATALAY